MPVRPSTRSDAGVPPPPSLGKLLSEHRSPRSLKVLAALSGPLLLLMGVAAFVGAVDHDPHEPLAARVGLGVLGFGFAAFGAAVLVVTGRKAATLVQLYEGGIVELFYDRRREVTWRDVRSFRHKLHAHGLYRFSEVTLELVGGERLRFNSQHSQGLEAIAAKVEREIMAETLPAMRKGLQSDDALSFGKLSASRQGIRYGKRLLPWAELATAQVRLGFLEVFRHGDAAPTLRVNVMRLERVNALLALVRERRRRDACSPPFAASFAFRQVRGKLWLQSLLVAPLVALFLGFGSYSAYRALSALDAKRATHAKAPGEYFVWALLGACLAIFLGLGWWHDVRVRLHRQRLARNLALNGKLMPALVLEKSYEEWSFHSGWRYRYLTPAGFEATDKLDVYSEAEPWSSGSNYLLALCSPDERESVLISASGYPLARLPATPEAS